MATDGLVFRREDGMGASGVNAALACLLSLTDDIVVMFDADGIVTLANERARQAFAGAGGELVGTPVGALFPAELQTDPQSHVARRALAAPVGDVADEGRPSLELPFPVDATTNASRLRFDISV